MTALSARLGRPATLDDVPDEQLDVPAAQGFDWVYLLGVWRTGAAGPAVSRGHAEWREEFECLLPDLTEEDICGSCFALTGYTVSPALGGDAALARLRARLAARGLRLMLDFVPNHTALDHPWVAERPRPLRPRHRGRSRPGAAQLHASRDSCRPGGARLRQGPLLLGLARHPPTGLWQPRAAGSHDFRTGSRGFALRRRPLRHGHARPTRHLLQHVGHSGGSLLAAGDRPRTSRLTPGSPSWARCTGPGVGVAAAWVRLHVRQAALRPSPRRSDLHGAGSSTRRPGLPTPLGRFLENHDQPQGGLHVRTGTAPGRCAYRIPGPGPPLLPPGPAGRASPAPAGPSLPSPGGADGPGHTGLLRGPAGGPEGAGGARRSLAAAGVRPGLGRQSRVGRVRGVRLEDAAAGDGPAAGGDGAAGDGRMPARICSWPSTTRTSRRSASCPCRSPG